MRASLISLILLVSISILGLAGCATPMSQTPLTEIPTQPPPASTEIPTQPPAPQATPTVNPEIVLEMVESLNAGDVEGSLAYFADDATVYLYGLPPTGFEMYRGKDQIRTLWEDSVANHFQWEVEVSKVYHDEVFLETNTWHDFHPRSWGLRLSSITTFIRSQRQNYDLRLMDHRRRPGKFQAGLSRSLPSPSRRARPQPHLPCLK